MSACKNRLPLVQEVITSISKLSSCALAAQLAYIKNKGHMKRRKPSHIWFVGFESCHFCNQTSKPLTDQLGKLELTLPFQWVEANFHWWDRGWGGGDILHSCPSWRSALPWCDAASHAPSGLSSALWCSPEPTKAATWESRGAVVCHVYSEITGKARATPLSPTA